MAGSVGKDGAQSTLGFQGLSQPIQQRLYTFVGLAFALLLLLTALVLSGDST